MLISAYVREKDRVLDFACGKGGDLTKYRKANVGTYTGVDIALESVRRDAVERYNGGGYPFPARFIAGDCFTADLTEVLEERAFDVISCQFAVHYRCAADDAPSRAVALVPLVALARTIPSPYTSNDTLTLHTPHPDTPTLRTAQLEHRGARASLVPQRESAAPSRGLLRRHHRRRQRPGSKTSRGGRPRLRQSHRRSSFRRRAQVQALPSRPRSVRVTVRLHARGRGDRLRGVDGSQKALRGARGGVRLGARGVVQLSRFRAP